MRKTVWLVLWMMLVTVLVVIFSNENVKATDGGEDWWDSNWEFRKQITIDHNMVDADLENFPVLIHNVSSDFINHAQPDGDDFVFVSENNTFQYNHEIEYYDISIGELIAWVNITTLSSTQDTIFYLYYGNLGCSNQENSTGTWDSNYLTVWHMDGTNIFNMLDSTIYNHNGKGDTGSPGYQSLGKIGYAVDFEQNDNERLNMDKVAITGQSSQISIEFWVKLEGAKGVIAESDQNWETWGESFGFCDSEQAYHNWWIAGTDMMTVGEFVYNCWTYDGTGKGGTSAYRNGFSVAIINPYFHGGWTNGGNDLLYIGTGGNPLDYFDGIIDELRVSKIARSSAWILTTYNNHNYRELFLSVGDEKLCGSLPTADFTYIPSNPLKTDVIQLTDTSTKDNGTIISWWWNFGDGYYSDLQNPVHCYYANGIYIANLTVIDNDGFKDSIQKTIIIGPVNNPPYTPSSPIPIGGAIDVPINQQLNWTGGDPDGDPVTYDIYFGTTSNPPKIVSNQSGLFYNPGILNYDTTYYWQIISWDTLGASSLGPIWSFTTETQPPPPSVVYVDDDYYEGGYNDGHTWGYNAFDKIQYGIDVVSGSTVYVNNGTYYENVVIDKSINLTGENNLTTIIDGNGSGDVIYISANYVNISGFTIQNSVTYPNAGIHSISSFNKINNNNILKNWNGIYTYSSNQNWINNNCISNNHNALSLEEHSNNNIIENNVLNYNSWCGLLLSENCQSNIINNNLIKGNEDGIYLSHQSDNNFITNNSIISQTMNGIYIWYTKGHNISYNYFSNNNDGIDGNGEKCYIYQNSFINNNIGIKGKDKDKIIDNLIENNTNYGIYLDSFTNGATLYYNNFKNNNPNAYDEGINSWDNGYPSGGNYWDDYIGTDTNDDNVGDIPYLIPGDSNQDNYPLGYFYPIADFIYSPTSPTTIDIIQFTDKSFDPDGSVVSWFWDFNDGNISTIQNPTHQYTIAGTYNVSLTVEDNDGKTNTTEIMITVTSIPAVEQLDQEQTSYSYNYDFYGSRWCAQSFKPTLSTITRVELFISKKGLSPNDITVSIRESLTGLDLTTISKSPGDISSTIGWVEFDFTDISVTPENTYYIVVKTSGGNTFNGYRWGFHYYTPYTRGSFYRTLNAGGTWSEYYYYDYCFKTYGLG